MNYKEFIYILIPFFVLILSQLTKVTIELISNKKTNLNRFLNGYGGMPSSHSAFVFSIVGLIIYTESTNINLLILALISALITAYDAVNLRMECSKQAVIINELMKGKKGFIPLKEKLGHTKEEVLAGIIFGLLTSYLLLKLFIIIFK